MEDSPADTWFSDQSATFGDRLAGAREEMGLSQQDLAGHLGVKLRTILDWENDLNDPRANKLQMLAGVLNVSIPWLLTGEGDGISAPGQPVSPDTEALLAEISGIRGQMADMAQALASLESRLRTTLKT